MPLLPRKFTEAEWLELSHLLSGGDLSACTKAELETFATMLSRPRAIERVAGTSNFDAACSMIRTMLIVRMSEEQNEQARRESRIALIIAVVALFAGILQAVVSVVQLVSNKPTQVEASTPLPIRAPLPIAVTLDSRKLEAASVPQQSIATPAPSTHKPEQSAPPPSAASKSSSK